MKKNEITRRNFIKGTIGTGILLAGGNLLSGCSTYDPKGLPTSILGKTGVRIPRIAIGLGSRFCNIDSEDEALSMLNYALDNGLYYWDTAWFYENKKNGVVSEERVGKVLKSRRDEIFISTKVTSRDPKEAMHQIETSLKRLQTDHVDILKIHDVRNMEDVAKVSEKGNLIDIVSKMKEEGVARYIGFSGHSNVNALIAMAQKGIFDTMLAAMNHWGEEPRQELLPKTAKEYGMGMMMMKAVRPKDNDPTLKPEDLIRYALSVEGADGLALGMDSLDVVKSNINILRNFVPMTNDEKKKMTARLAPFYNHKNLVWMNPSYRDGHWA